MSEIISAPAIVVTVYVVGTDSFCSKEIYPPTEYPSEAAFWADEKRALKQRVKEFMEGGK